MAGYQAGKENSFDDVIFTDLKRPQAETLLEQYHAEGQKKFRKIAKQYHKRDLKAQQRKGSLTFFSYRFPIHNYWSAESLVLFSFVAVLTFITQREKLMFMQLA